MSQPDNKQQLIREAWLDIHIKVDLQWSFSKWCTSDLVLLFTPGNLWPVDAFAIIALSRRGHRLMVRCSFCFLLPLCVLPNVFVMSLTLYLLLSCVCICHCLFLIVFISACIVGGRVKEGAWSLCVLAEAEPPLLGLGTRRSSQGGRSCLPKTKYKKILFFMKSTLPNMRHKT